jgi:hypothetical protein
MVAARGHRSETHRAKPHAHAPPHQLARAQRKGWSCCRGGAAAGESMSTSTRNHWQGLAPHRRWLLLLLWLRPPNSAMAAPTQLRDRQTDRQAGRQADGRGLSAACSTQQPRPDGNVRFEYE